MAAGRMTSARSSRSPSCSTRCRKERRDSFSIALRSSVSGSDATLPRPGSAPTSLASASMLPPVATSPAGFHCWAMTGMRSVAAYSSSSRWNRPGSSPETASSSSSRTEPMVCDSLHRMAVWSTSDTSTLPPPRSTSSHFFRPNGTCALTAS